MIGRSVFNSKQIKMANHKISEGFKRQTFRDWIIIYSNGHERARLFAVNPFILRCVRCDNLPRRGEGEREQGFFADAELLISHAFSSDRFGVENGLDRASSSQYHVKSTRFPREWRGIRTVSDGDNVEQPELM